MASRKERVWLEEYLKCWNATEAARRAQYKWPDKIGTRKLAKFSDEIEARIDELVMSADEALVRLSEIARGEYAAYLLPDGAIDFERMIRDGKGHLVHKLRDTREGKSVEFYDMQKALVDIGRHHQLFTDRMDVTSKGEKLEGYDPYADVVARIQAHVESGDAIGEAEDT